MWHRPLLIMKDSSNQPGNLIMATATTGKLNKKAFAFSIAPEDLDEADRETDRKMETLRKKGKGRAIEPAKPISAAGLLDGIVVIDERDVPLSQIKRSKDNPRTAFDDELIAEMATDIVTICRLNPLTVREDSYELIDGETRHRAADVAQAKALRCKIIRCTDAQAACIRLLTSLQRRDLHAIDRARGIRALQQQHGLSQRQLEDVLKMKQGSMSNLTRLLDLPADWQQRVISGEITPTDARHLMPYSDEPEFLELVAKQLKFANENNDWDDTLEDAVYHCLQEHTSPLAKLVNIRGNYRTITIQPSLECREELRIKRINGDERCFNVKLAEALFDDKKQEAEASADKRESKKEKAPTKADPKQAAANAAKQKEIFAKKLYRYQLQWAQTELVKYLKTADKEALMRLALIFAARGPGAGERQRWLTARLRPGYQGTGYDLQPKDITKLDETLGDRLWTTARSMVCDFVSCSFDGWNPNLTPAMLTQIAVTAKISLKSHWSKSCTDWKKTIVASSSFPSERDFDPLEAYLAILTRDQLVDLASEWKLKIEKLPGLTRSDLSKAISTQGRGKSTPTILLEVKPVNLQ